MWAPTAPTWVCIPSQRLQDPNHPLPLPPSLLTRLTSSPTDVSKPLSPLPSIPLLLTCSSIVATPACSTFPRATCLVGEPPPHGHTEMAWGHHQEHQLLALGLQTAVHFDSPALSGQAPGLSLSASTGNPLVTSKTRLNTLLFSQLPNSQPLESLLPALPPSPSNRPPSAASPSPAIFSPGYLLPSARQSPLDHCNGNLARLLSPTPSLPCNAP